jgi:hypothetical protein
MNHRNCVAYKVTGAAMMRHPARRIILPRIKPPNSRYSNVNGTRRRVHDTGMPSEIKKASFEATEWKVRNVVAYDATNAAQIPLRSTRCTLI